MPLAKSYKRRKWRTVVVLTLVVILVFLHIHNMNFGNGNEKLQGFSTDFVQLETSAMNNSRESTDPSPSLRLMRPPEISLSPVLLDLTRARENSSRASNPDLAESNADDTLVSDGAAKLHVVCSSDCTLYQRWQVITQVHSARAVGQSGLYTWLVSGCSSAAEDDTRRAVLENFPVKAQRPLLHFTPDFSDMSIYGGPFADGSKKRTFKNRKGRIVRSPYGNKYNFNNKPNALRHWAQQRFKGPTSSTSASSSSAKQPYEVIVLIDPDFVFLKSLDDHRPLHSHPSSSLASLVEASAPAAQEYGLGDQWLSFNLSAICGEHSPCTRVTSPEVYKHYSAGPPYVISSADVRSLAEEWSRFVPPTYDQYPMLYAEMFAYSMAAAHLGLKHRLLKGLMTGCMVGWPQVTSTNRQAFRSSVEALEALEGGQAGEGSASTTLSSHGVSAGGASSCFATGLSPPPFLHYCQHYQSANGFSRFAKRGVPYSILECTMNASASGLLSDPRKTKGAAGRSGKLSARTLLAQSGKSVSKETGASGGRDHATGKKHNDVTLGWNALAYCSVVRAIDHARDQRCLFGSS